VSTEPTFTQYAAAAHLHLHTHSTLCHHHHHHFFAHTTGCHCPVVLVLICPCTYALTCIVAPTTVTFSCALCPSQPCMSTTELSPYPTTLPSHQQPHAHIHDPFFITWVGLKGAINNFIKATRSYVWMDRNKVGILHKGSCQGASETRNVLHPSTHGALMYLWNGHSRG